MSGLRDGLVEVGVLDYTDCTTFKYAFDAVMTMSKFPLLTFTAFSKTQFSAAMTI